MGKFNPAIMDKTKWKEKTIGAIRVDIDRREGIIADYAMAFFDPFEADPEKQFSFTIRLAHSPEYMDEDQKERLEASLRYVMAGVQKIFNVDKAEIEQWVKDGSPDALATYIKTARFDS